MKPFTAAGLLTNAEGLLREVLLKHADELPVETVTAIQEIQLRMASLKWRER